MRDHLPSSGVFPRRILVRGVNWLGDAVMTTPALHRLSQHFPQARITLLTHDKLADLWADHPSVDDVMTFRSGESPWSVARRIRAWHFANGFFELHRPPSSASPQSLPAQLAQRLNDAATPLLTAYARLGLWSPLLFDLALILPNSVRSALECRLAGIPQRIGYARSGRDFLLTQAIPSREGHVAMRKRPVREVKRLAQTPDAAPERPPGSQAHQVHDYLHLVAALGAEVDPVAPHLVVRPQEVELATERFRLGAGAAAQRPIFGLICGAQYGPAKRWPVDRFIAAARDIQKRTNCVWLLLGGRSDLPLCEEIDHALRASQAAVHNLAGKTSLRELMALLKLCRVLLTNDSGPMHVAAALGTPVVVPFGSTSPELTGPGMPGGDSHQLLRASAPCSPCFRRSCPVDFRCMTQISADRVVAAVLLAATSKR